VVLVPDQGAVRELAAAGLHPPLHDRIHPRHPDAAEHDLDPRVRRDSVERFGELPLPGREPRATARVLHVHEEVLRGLHPQDAVGCAVAPRIRIRRLACSITANTYSRAPDRVTVSRKSQADRASAWERRKSAYVLEARSGAGSIPASFKISHTVDAATFTPSTNSSRCRRL
jgi:hypothetical protein